jgi:hypothetical protein
MNTIDKALALLSSVSSVPTEVEETEIEIQPLTDLEKLALRQVCQPALNGQQFLHSCKNAFKRRKQDGKIRPESEIIADQTTAIQHFTGYSIGLPFGTQLDLARWKADTEIRRERGEIYQRPSRNEGKGFVKGMPDPLLDLHAQAARVRYLLEAVEEIFGAPNYGKLRMAVADCPPIAERAIELTGTRESLDEDRKVYAQAVVVHLHNECKTLNRKDVTAHVRANLNQMGLEHKL